MKLYRVEFRISNKNYFRKDCFEEELKKTIELMKIIRNKEGKGKCYYRSFPLMKNEKVYF